MKKIKKLVAIALAAVMVFALGSMAFGAETNSSDKGTITISGVEEGVSVSAYQIVKANYDADGNFLGYEQLYNAGDFSIGSDGSYDESALTEANLAALYAVASQNSVYKTVEADSTGAATFTDMELGSYLFVVTGSESTVYGMVIGSVYYVAKDGSWTTEEGAVNVKSDENLWVKSSTPTVTKEEVGGSIEDEDWSHGGSADVGDELTYHITVANIPTYEGQYPVFNVTDEIADELTITEAELAALSVYVVDENGDKVDTLTKGTDYTVTDYTTTPLDDGKYGFVIDFVVNGEYTLNDYAGQTLVIEFGATVTAETDADLATDDVDHENDVTLDYATTSYVYGMDVTEDDTDHDYTFNAKIQKTDATDEKNPLAGATFALYTDDACNTAYTQNGSAITAISGDDGYFEFTGLEEGTYYMKETEAPAGYALNTNIYKIVITASYNEDGTIQTGYSIMVYDTTNNDAVVGNAIVSTTNAAIENTKVGELPSTGGRGTLIFTIIGCAIVVCAVVGVVATRRRRAA